VLEDILQEVVATARRREASLVSYKTQRFIFRMLKMKAE
jgi:hypothetical protein